ncbi:hypothetical protein METBIDRAFT_30037 [Metschnikowia bicuspidata var. bicuspidata NRRL YB-4993]|uniref:Uncharacterized protein n=1 Tax=Metschnikowia bicuspidata var. bicuspidata NRRL YB-4993 TaxID=869754 RepID=A0A1A0HHX2_9ASCO|nr:hypothetical protein METBIDRAFT_30037 [Metschnikowia bicuspidata var. bicuspidata NRRL YB-4993]OBA23601.1 hypothetical protein METBIDRAFT_30037 [Metschnikowia bicuspidata var. bicuspidata NRRL YB-4993]
MENIEQYLFDLVALKIQASYNNVNGTVLCELDSDSLIFKLSGILEHSYPIWDYLPLSCFTSATIVFYILYALGAQILYINIFALASFISWKRQLPLAKIFIEIVKILWNGPATIL